MITQEVRRRLVPWEGRAARADVVLMLLIGAVVAYGAVLRPLRPFLIASNPLLLALLTDDLTAVGAAAAFARVEGTALWPVVLAGTAGAVKFGLLTWWAGRRWGTGMVAMVSTGERSRRIAHRVAALPPWALRTAVMVAALPGVPSVLVHVMAGWAGMRARTFVLLDALGSAVTVALVAGLGYGLGQYAVDVVLLVDRYAGWVSLAIIVSAFVAPLVRRLLRLLRGLRGVRGRDRRQIQPCSRAAR
jgi:membrane protein DedA with SNARE-associated domain